MLTYPDAHSAGVALGRLPCAWESHPPFPRRLSQTRARTLKRAGSGQSCAAWLVRRGVEALLHGWVYLHRLQLRISSPAVSAPIPQSGRVHALKRNVERLYNERQWLNGKTAEVRPGPAEGLLQTCKASATDMHHRRAIADAV